MDCIKINLMPGENTQNLSPVSVRVNQVPVAVVAGGAGFLGSHLCEALLSQNLLVVALDNLHTGNRDNIKNLFNRPNFSFLEHDLNSPLPSSVQKADYVFHLAGVEEYLNGLDVSLETLLVNSLGTKHLLEYALKNQAKFLLTSSFDIYSGAISSTNLANYSGVTELEAKKYSHHEAKRFSEALVSEYYRKYEMDVRIVRTADLYGPRMPIATGEPMGGIIKQSLESKILTVTGDGLEIIHPTFVTDFVYGSAKAMFAQNTKGQIYTLVNPEEVTVLNLVYLFKKIRPDLAIKFEPSKKILKFPLHSLEVAKTKTELGWTAKVSLEEGLKLTLAFFDSHPKPSEAKGTPVIPELKYRRFAEESVKMSSPPPTREVSPSRSLPDQTKKENKAAIVTGLTDAKAWRFSLPKFSRPQFSSWPGFHLPLGARDLSFLRPGKGVLLTAAALTLSAALIFWPVLEAVFLIRSGINNLNIIKTKGTDYQKAVGLARTARADFEKAGGNLAGFNWVFNLAGRENEAKNGQKLISLAVKGTESLEHLLLAVESMSEAVHAITGEKEDISLKESLERAEVELGVADENLGLLEAELKTTDPEFFKKVPFIDGDLREVPEKLSRGREMVSLARKFIHQAPELIGLDSQRAYLVFFQNNTEIRPTGGFLGSYAYLVFEGGHLTKMKIEDIYTLDGQLKGRINPPDEILHYLGQPNWYLRDSNWSPDFPLSAERAEWFVDKEAPGTRIDGVAALDLYLVRDLLKITGPVDLPDFNERINSDNLFEKTEYKAEINFFPGSTQKKDFLAALAKTITEKSLNLPSDRWPELALLLTQALKEKHLLIYLHDFGAEDIFASKGWSGGFVCPADFFLNCREADNLSLVEANLGANKANYFIKRETTDEITLGKEGEVRHKIRIDYTNTSPNDAWPGGRYKNYLRVYLPEKAKLLSLENGDGRQPRTTEILNENVLKKLKDDEFLVISRSEQFRFPGAAELNNFQSHGFLVEVPPLAAKSVILEYESGFRMDYQEDEPTYRFFWRKQPGTDKDLIKIKVAYPSFLTVKNAGPMEIKGAGALNYWGELSTDRYFDLTFTKKP